ncbi:MAG: MBOAT family protein [Lachnospiraceae bacterium]|nr:MBOAT family protein [Candidatus Colinaster scatohippi]
MVFSSLYFSFFFLPLVVLIYYLAKEKYRNYILLVASLYFYSFGEPKFVFVMMASIIINYLLAIAIDKFKSEEKTAAAKQMLLLDIVLNVGLLFVFKYLDFTIGRVNSLFGAEIPLAGIVLPIGISFFTFQAMSYVIDVYRGTVEVQKNLFYLALYISFFPQLIAGPIVRYSTIADQISNRTCSLDKFGEGTRRFFLGFAKKVIIANNISIVVEEVFEQNVMDTNPILLWIGAIGFSLQILYDFSGYSDMAIGLGKIFGFDFNENFNYPYFAESVTDFWRRWHMSLGQWFRDYVYIPLGGSRVSVPRHIINLLVVWSLTGIWHGASFTFLIWGLEYFFLLVLEKFLVHPEKRKSKIFKIIWRMFTVLCIVLGFVIFNSSGTMTGIKYCLSLFGLNGVPFVIDDTVIRYMREYSPYMIMGIVFATPIMKVAKEKIENSKLANVTSVLIPIGYGIIFLWSVSFIILGVHNPFIYFNF